MTHLTLFDFNADLPMNCYMAEQRLVDQISNAPTEILNTLAHRMSHVKT